MEESILITIKYLLGIDEENTDFDIIIIPHINSVFMILQQLGVGPKTGFSITGSDETWGDFLDSNTNFESIKSYIYMKVRLLFDPPSSSAILEASNKLINELEWRLNVEAES